MQNWKYVTDFAILTGKTHLPNIAHCGLTLNKKYNCYLLGFKLKNMISKASNLPFTEGAR